MTDKEREINSMRSTKNKDTDTKYKPNMQVKGKQSNSNNRKTNLENKYSTKITGRNIQGNNRSNHYNSYTKNNRIAVINDRKTNWFLVPLVLVILVIPLIVKMKIFDPHLMQFSWFPNVTEEIDFFLYYKQWILTAILFLMILIVLYKFYKNKNSLQLSAIFIPLATYAILSLLSAVFSDNALLSFRGSRDQFEPVFAILGYCMLVFYALQFINTEEDVKTIIKYLLVSILILSLLGLSQFLGHDFFGTKFGTELITSLKDQKLDFVFEKGRVYLTFYNPNYVGVYASLVAPIFLILLLFSKKVLNSILYLLALIGLTICAIGSLSLTGIVSIAVALFGILIFMWRYLLKRFYITIPLFLFLLVALFVINKQTNNALLQRVQEIYHLEKIEPNLSDITTYDDHVSITYKGNTINMSFILDGETAGYITLIDDNGIAINNIFDPTTNSFLIQDDRFPGFSFAPAMYREYLSFYVKIDGTDWIFTNQTEDGTYYYHTLHGKLDKMTTAPSVGFQGYERYASGRGYIWSRTIPLIKKYIFLGSGPDTFVIAFPHQDYLGYYNYGFQGNIVTKPHNLYLQIAIQTGLLSLIAFLVFYGMYFISCIRLYIKGRFNSLYAQVGIAIFIGTIAYMVAGLSNDSSITTAPVFWTLIGVGIAVNYKAKPLIFEESKALKSERMKKKEVSRE